MRMRSEAKLQNEAAKRSGNANPRSEAAKRGGEETGEPERRSDAAKRRGEAKADWKIWHVILYLANWKLETKHVRLHPSNSQA